MPDGPSTAKIILSVSGLAFDLIGAFLLSIPMVWSARKAADFIKNLLDRLPFSEYVPYRPVKMRLAILFLTLLLFITVFAAYIFMKFDIQVSFGSVSFPFIYLIALPVALAGSFAAIILFFTLLSDGLSYLSDGNHDRRIGAFGLLLLGGGFILQFIVNMQWVQ